MELTGVIKVNAQLLFQLISIRFLFTLINAIVYNYPITFISKQINKISFQQNRFCDYGYVGITEDSVYMSQPLQPN